MEAVVKANFVKRIDWWTLRKFIKRIAGGDKRTVEAYREHLLDFEFIKPHAASTEAMLKDIQARTHLIFEINLLKLPYAQTRLDEIIQYEKKVMQEKAERTPPMTSPVKVEADHR
jgi:hypothetical protein